MFRDTGYNDYYAGQVDNADAYYRKLQEFRKLVSDGLIDVDAGDLDKIPEIVGEATASIESMDARINATINVEGANDLKDAERIILLIKDALREIDELRVEPVTKETLSIIKQYRREIDTLVAKWSKLSGYGMNRTMAYSAFSSQQPYLYKQIQNTSNIKATRPKEHKQAD